ncbi:MAG: SDR family oxidoreductase [Pseudomonadota bacterium]
MIEPDEIAALVSFLCSDNGSAVTGSSWAIDCGWTAQ